MGGVGRAEAKRIQGAKQEKRGRDGNLLRCHFRGFFASLSWVLEKGAFGAGVVEQVDSSLSSDRNAE